LQKFDAELGALHGALSGLVRDGNLSEAARLAHKMVGLCDVLGARTLSTALRAFEIALGADDGSTTALPPGAGTITPPEVTPGTIDAARVHKAMERLETLIAATRLGASSLAARARGGE
jgi:HPt (histidine-containing phosphotransfer) domain-containing protein